jgi:penicillin-binding protein 1C
VLKRLVYLMLGFGAGCLITIALPISERDRSRAPIQSLRVTDRNGVLLREVLSADYVSSYPVTLNDVPKSFLDATLAAEDKNFYGHWGIDIGATLRALWQNVTSLKIISGASTITQQTARMMLKAERGFFSKLYVMLYALRLEAHLTKSEILEEYINRAPYGNQTYGIAAAAKCYFNKPPSELTLAESALLAGLPQSPVSYDPLRHIETAKKRQTETLRRMVAANFISETEQADALQQPIAPLAPRQTFLAPHVVDYLLKSDSLKKNLSETPPQTLITTIDIDLQQACEKLMHDHLSRLKKNHITNAALVIMENHTGEIVTMIGSADYFNADIDGEYNGAVAARQPGSSLKPFTYALALENGLTPSSLLPDLPLPFPVPGRRDESGENGTSMFYPQNFDRKYHGAVRLRQALACSYNITAVKALETVGVENLYTRLKQLDFTTLTEPAPFYGLGLTLGNSDVRLLEMVRAYAVFVRGGKQQKENFIRAAVTASGDSLFAPPAKPDEHSVFSPQVAYLIADILNDNAARRPSFGANSVLRFPFAVACKTGTTKDYRDNWTLGATEDFTVGVWVGNFNGEPMRNISGVDGAGPLMHDAVMELYKRFPEKSGFNKTEFDMPQGIRMVRVCPVSGERAGAWCDAAIEEKFISGKEPHNTCSFHKRLTMDSRNGLLATPDTPKEFQREKTFVDYPTVFREWAKGQQKELPPREYSSLSTRNDSVRIDLTNDRETPRITYPKSGMVFAIDATLRREFQAVAFTAHLPKGAQHIEWRLNGKPVSDGTRENNSGAVSQVEWRLQTGAYTLETIVQTERGEMKSAPVFFTVVD